MQGWRGYGLATLAVASAAVGGCYQTLGLEDYNFTSSSSGSGASSTGGQVTSGSSGSGGTGGSPEPKAPDAAWAVGFGNGVNHSANAVAADSAGDVYVTGRADTLDFNCPTVGAGTGTAYVMKLAAADGKCLGVTRFGSNADGMSVAVASDGTVIVGGKFEGDLEIVSGEVLSASGIDGFVAKLGSDLVSHWAEQLTDPMGNVGDQIVTGVAITTDYIVISGYTSTSMVLGAAGMSLVASTSGKDAFVIRLTVGLGYKDQLVVFSSDAAGGAQIAYNVAALADGSYAIGGSTDGATVFQPGPADPKDIKTAKGFFYAQMGPTNKFIFGDALAVTLPELKTSLVAFDRGGNVVLAGEFLGELALDKDVKVTNDGLSDIFLTAFRGDPTLLQLGSPVFMQSSRLRGFATHMDSAVVAGDFNGKLSFISPPGVSVDSEKATNGFVAKVDTSDSKLTPSWIKRIGDEKGDSGAEAVTIDKGGRTVVAGHLEGSVDFGGGRKVDVGGKGIFVATLKD